MTHGALKKAAFDHHSASNMHLPNYIVANHCANDDGPFDCQN